MDETRGRNLTRQVHQRLLERVREAGKGAERRIEEALDRRPGWLRDRRRTGAIELGLLLDALDYLGEDPKRFFRLALGEEEPDGLRLLGDPPPIVKLIRTQGETPPRGKPCRREELETLDRLRYYHPYRVLELAESAVTRTPRTLLPHLLGIVAGAYRMVLDLDQGEHTIAAAIDIARKQNDQPARGALLQRLSYIAGDRGDHAEGLRLAEQAAGVHIHCRNLTSVGQCLVDQGIRLFYLNRLRDAIAVHTTALEYLSDSEQWSRFSALQYLAFIHQSLGEPRIALTYSIRAEKLLPHLKFGLWLAGLMRWVRASINIDLGQLTEAEENLFKMVEIYQPLHVGETALATTALVRVKLLMAKPWEAYETAKSMLHLLEPLRHNRNISATIADLLRGGVANLTLDRVERVIASLEKDRKRPDWRLLRTTDA